jgi:hypothetical protein
VLDDFFTDKTLNFPSDVHSDKRNSPFISRSPSRATEDKHDTSELTTEETSDPGVKVSGSLLPPPHYEENCTYLFLRIEKIGLKTATQYLDPFITVLVLGKTL